MATYHLIEDDDKILVGLSGGKDSLLLTELLAKRAQIQHPRFTVEAIHVRMENIHYETDTSYLQQFCSDLGVTLHVRTTRFEVDGTSRKQKQPCFLCSWNRRKQLFNLAQELGCNKIALGHHQDDIIHTALMNLTFQAHFSTMPVRLKMRQGYEKQQKLCPYETGSHRTDMKQIYEQLEALNPEVRYNIWGALEADNKLTEE